MPIDKPWFDAWIDDDGSGNVGTVWNKSELSKMIDGLDGSRHCCELYAPANIALPAGWNVVNMFGLTIDVPAGQSPASGTIQIPPNGGGLYLVYSITVFAAATGGLRAAQINRSGALFMTGQAIANPTAQATITLLRIASLQAGHQLQLNAYCDVATQMIAESRFGMVRL